MYETPSRTMTNTMEVFVNFLADTDAGVCPA
jgi:hypothetical protein